MVCNLGIYSFTGIIFGIFMLFVLLLFLVLRSPKWILIFLLFISAIIVFSSPLIMAMVNTTFCD